MLSWRVCLALAAAFHVRTCASWGDFLAPPRGAKLLRAEHQTASVAELQRIFAGPHVEGFERVPLEPHLIELQKILRYTFEALPKTASGGLSAAGARYAIHRLFVQRDGWQVKGLAPTGGSWLPSAPALGLGDRLPAHLRDLFEERFGTNDFSLEELALMTVAIESLIHGEAVQRLNETYNMLGRDARVALSEDGAMDVIYSCMTAYLAGVNASHFSRADFEAKQRSVEQSHAKWPQVKSLIHEVQLEVCPKQSEYTFSDVARILEGVNHRLGQRVDEGTCQELEDNLLKLEEGNGTGRVRLSDFYASHLEAENWQFQHRPEYLRQAGVLDESDPAVPRIIIPNYLVMKANCFNVSSYYDLCCVDLCEDYFDLLEEGIKSPSATPQELIKVVTTMDTGSSPHGRNLSDALKKKLMEVAEHHGGQVPLHGRLFAQWMHFAFPNECPYPHLSGTTRPVSSSEWFEETGTPAIASEAEVQSVIDASRNASGPAACDDSEEGMCMWNPEEELVDAASWKAMHTPRPQPAPQQHSMRAGLRAFAFVGLSVSSVVAMSSLLRQSASELRRGWGGCEKPEVKTELP